jgi:peptide deformylase
MLFVLSWKMRLPSTRPISAATTSLLFGKKSSSSIGIKLLVLGFQILLMIPLTVVVAFRGGCSSSSTVVLRRMMIRRRGVVAVRGATSSTTAAARKQPFGLVLDSTTTRSTSSSNSCSNCRLLSSIATATTTTTNNNNNNRRSHRWELFSSSSSSSSVEVGIQQEGGDSTVKKTLREEEEVDPGVVEGTNLRVLKYPHPSLRLPNVEVTEEEIRDGSIAQVAKEMLLVMYAAEGMGLAAPQVGINKRLMVFNVSGDPKKWLQETILINPQIVSYSPAKDSKLEACLSFPKMNGPVERSKSITVEAYNIRGKKMKLKYKGWDARVFQHEYDHLDGIVYIDRLTPEDRELVQPRLNELLAEFGDGNGGGIP